MFLYIYLKIKKDFSHGKCVYFLLARSSAEKNAADIKVRLDGFSGRSSRKGKTLFFKYIYIMLD